MKSIYLLIAFYVLFTAFHLKANTINYELVATKESINISLKKKVDFALLLNVRVRPPTLDFT